MEILWSYDYGITRCHGWGKFNDASCPGLLPGHFLIHMKAMINSFWMSPWSHNPINIFLRNCYFRGPHMDADHFDNALCPDHSIRLRIMPIESYDKSFSNELLIVRNDQRHPWLSLFYGPHAGHGLFWQCVVLWFSGQRGVRPPRKLW